MDYEAFYRRFDNNPFLVKNHVTIKLAEDDHSILELIAQEDSLNPMGMVHGGALFTMADSAAGFAASSDGRTYVTLSSNFTFLRSGMPGDVIHAEGKVRRRGRTTCYADADLTNQKGELLASGNFIFFHVPNENLPK